MDEFERAIDDYSQAIRIHPNYPEAYHNRGIAYHRLGLYEDSERDLAKVGELRAKTENGTPNGDNPSA
jgi:tetratricopeptide (TPR) repeat protein